MDIILSMIHGKTMRCSKRVALSGDTHGECEIGFSSPPAIDFCTLVLYYRFCTVWRLPFEFCYSFAILRVGWEEV